MGSANRRYEWKRFWCPREGQNTLDLEGYLLDPDGKHGWYGQPCAVAFDGIASRPCLLLLGEPGIGKSSAMARQREVAARQLPAGEELLDIDFRYDRDLKGDLLEHPKFKGWLDGKHTLHLFLDSLDECPEADAASRILGKLRRGPVEKLRLRVACRTAEVPLVLEPGLHELWGQGGDGKSLVGIYELAPLRKTDVELAARDEGLDAGAFLAEVARRGAVALAIKPVTLSFLLRRYRARGALPNTRWAIYEEGCRLLCEEGSLTRRDHGETGRLDVRQRMMVAARIAAVCLLGNRSMIRLGSDPGDLPEDALLAEVLRGGSERAGQEDFDVDARAVRETLTMTGLFNERGQGRLLGWAHQTYAEFLAAYFLCERGLGLEDLEGILFPSGERVQIVPALREVAAWMASADAATFKKLMDDDPRTLLQSDVAMVGDAEREMLVGALLRRFADRDLIDVDVGSKAVYRKLAHHRLPEQLEPWIRGRDRYFIARRGAIYIAEACEERKLQDALADVALDPEDDVNIRANAARAVTAIADEITKLRLRPLAHGQAGKDPEDELKGYALTALWPRHMEARELFNCLMRPRKRGYIGAYRTFIERETKKELSPDVLVEAIAWAKRQPPRYHPLDPINDFADRLIRRAWEHMDDPAILEALVRLAHVRFSRHEHLLSERAHGEQAKDRAPDEHRKRHRFVEAYLHSSEQNEREYWTFETQDLLSPDDLPWMLARLEAAGDPALRRRWAGLVNAAICHKGFTFEVVNAAVEVASRHSELHEELRWILDPIELDSPLAEQQKRSWQETEKLKEQLRRERRERRIDRPHAERVVQCLERAEQGDLDAFWRMQRLMSLHPASTDDSDHGRSSLTRLPGWRDADDLTRRRMLLVAKQYVMERDAEPGRWLARGWIHQAAISGYWALSLLKDLDPAGFSELPASAWRRWAPAIVGYCMSSTGEPTDEETRRELVRLAYGVAPEETLWTLAFLVEEENRNYNSITVYHRLIHCWDDRLGALLLLKAQDPSLAPSAFACLLGELLDRRVEGARKYAASLLALPLPRRRGPRGRARAAAKALFAHTADAGWPVLKHVFRAAPGFGRKVVLGVAPEMPRRQVPRWQHLSEDELAELFLWMEAQFPRARDRNLYTGRMQAIEPRDEAAELRDELLNSLTGRGTRAALDAILRIERAHPGKDWISFARIRAQESTLQGTRRLLSPREVIALLPRAAGHVAPADEREARSTNERPGAMPLVDRCDVLLITVTQTETQAVLDAAEPMTSCTAGWVRGHVKIYHDLGEIGGARVFLVQSETGAKTQGGSVSTTLRGILERKPSLVVMVGIAFGVDPDKQPIGRILVSTQIQDYELERYGTDPLTGDLDVRLRGDKVPAPARALNQFKTAMHTWDDGEFGGIECCLILSGDKLIDNIHFRNELLKRFPEARGGEMEAAGVSAVAQEEKVDWMVVKAVCDWADGRKHEDKEERQALAARRAASFVFHALGSGIFAP
ncbi:hypothetical protein BE11_18935 [Sorangium cellulosum]|nr:hypothetical protein BE11_18935 [Sorangium cellulosum]